MATSGAIVGIGELLWDLLPSGSEPGGAPFNFAFHCHQLGHEAVIVSRVGNDELGDRLRAEVRSRGLTDEFIQIDPEHPTGTVDVQLDHDGQPRYTITDRVSYDFLEWTPAVERLARSCGAVCFGTLAQRHRRSRESIQRFVQEARGTANPATIVFDINLRVDRCPAEALEPSLKQADWLKLNTDELSDLRWIDQLTTPSQLDGIRGLAQEFRQLELMCLTRGEQGCLVWARGQEVIDHPGIRVSVADTVGAGDAFTAGLLTQVREGKSLAAGTDFATRLAALVASRPGGTPHIARDELEALAR